MEMDSVIWALGKCEPWPCNHPDFILSEDAVVCSSALLDRNVLPHS